MHLYLVPTITEAAGVIDCFCPLTYWNDGMPPDDYCYVDDRVIATAPRASQASASGDAAARAAVRPVYHRRHVRRGLRLPGRGLASLALATALLSGGSAVAASDWSSSFAGSSVASKVGTSDGPVLVVVAGQPSAELADAADALVSALQGAGATVTREDVSYMDDEPSFARGRAVDTGAARVVVLRVLGEAGGGLLQAVVSVYDHDGNQVNAFTGRPGGSAVTTQVDSTKVTDDAAKQEVLRAIEQAIVAQARSGSMDAAAKQALLAKIEAIVESGSQSGALDDATKQALLQKFGKFYGSSMQVDGGPMPANSPAQAAYDRDFVGYDYFTGPFRAYRGTDRLPLRGAQLYHYLGRDDLAGKYKKRRRIRIGLLSASAVLFFGSLVPGVVLASLPNHVHTNEKASLILMLAGIPLSTGMFIGGLFIAPQPVSSSEARRIIDGFNDKLRKKVGLPPADGTMIHVRPYFGGTSGGMMLQGTF